MASFVRYTNCVEKERSYVSGFSAIGVTAALAVLILVTTVGWQIWQTIREKDAKTSYVATDTQTTEEATASNDNPLVTASSATGTTVLGASILADIVSRYASLQQQGIYTHDVGQQVAEKMAATLKPEVSYTQYGVADIKTNTDTSKEGALAYRQALQLSLMPLLKNTQPEFEIFAYYIDTKDEVYLTRLKEIARDYRAAASATALVVVPKDAAPEHVAILNAMQQFAATLDAMAENATDPFASAALLRTYNQAEADMLTSFKSLALYYQQKNT